MLCMYYFLRIPLGYDVGVVPITLRRWSSGVRNELSLGGGALNKYSMKGGGREGLAGWPGPRLGLRRGGWNESQDGFGRGCD